MKNGKPHIVHLSEPARAVLRAIPRVDGCDLVFTTTAYRARALRRSAEGKAQGRAAPDFRLLSR